MIYGFKTLIRMSALLAVVVTATVLVSCNRMDEFSEGMAFNVQASCPLTKTYLSNGSHRWVKGDFLRILSEDGVAVSSSACEVAVTTFDFTVSDWPSGKTPAYAVYCGQKDVVVEPSAEGGVITARLEDNQYITHRESFSKTANLSVDKTETGISNFI